jgi:hypothetical protein
MVMTVEQTVEIGADRRISLDLTVPETVPGGKTQVVVLFIPQTAATGTGKSEGEPQAGFGLGTVPAEQLKKLLADSAQPSDKSYNVPLDLREAQIAISFNSGKSHKDKSFIKHAGCLKNSHLFQGDSVAIQKEMRSEWD